VRKAATLEYRQVQSQTIEASFLGGDITSSFAGELAGGMSPEEAAGGAALPIPAAPTPCGAWRGTFGGAGPVTCRPCVFTCQPTCAATCRITCHATCLTCVTICNVTCHATCHLTCHVTCATCGIACRSQVIACPTDVCTEVGCQTQAPLHCNTSPIVCHTG